MICARMAAVVARQPDGEAPNQVLECQIDESVSGPSSLLPLDDVRSEPQTDVPVALVHQRAREVPITMEVGGDAVVVREPEERSDLDGAQEVAHVDGPSHQPESRNVDGSSLVTDSLIG